MLGNKRGQSTVEYGLLIAVIVVALLAVNIYLKRGVQGRLRESSDQIGRQFDPEDYTLAWQTEGSGQTTTTESRTAGVTSSNIEEAETVTRSEHDEYGNAVPGQHY